ncbi:MAG: FAD-binding oxidoreductase [Bergeyella sp.]|nr:FAD-binding oxidoreductase [Bergeyella sp.]
MDKKKVDTIIVGGGFAGLFLAYQLLSRKCSFVLFSDHKTGASLISAGVVNPVILKKFSIFPEGGKQLACLAQVLGGMESILQEKIKVTEPVYRIFHSEKEKEIWIKKSSQKELQPFLSTTFSHFEGIENPFGCGKVFGSFRIEVEVLITKMKEYLEKRGCLIREKFEYRKLRKSEYENIKCQRIIFAEGIGVKKNPFFGDLPVIPNKGHKIGVRFLEQDFALKKTIKKKHFLFPLNASQYYYGGTYDRDNISAGVDCDALEELKKSLKEITEIPYIIENRGVAHRPTVLDRKPILGRHKNEPHLYILNGLGTRGILNAAYYSSMLIDFIEKGMSLPKEVSVDRFMVEEYTSKR